MKNIFYILLFFILPLTSFAQKQNNIWYFGDNAGLDFNSGAPVPLFDGQLVTNEGCASVADKNTGQLLFYTDGTNIWDKTHSIMPANEIAFLLGNSSSTQSALIVPMPGSETEYYVFTVDAQAGNFNASTSGFGGLAYNIVDMSLNGGLGDLSVVNQHLLTPTCEKLTATMHCNGHDIWVVVHQWETDTFYAYLLTNSGISAPVISHSGIIHRNVGSDGDAETIGYMKFSPDGKRLGVACYIDLNTVQIFDFDNATGAVSNPITDNNYPLGFGYDGPYGLTFSPNSSKLYVSLYGFIDSSIIYQYDLLAGNHDAVIASRTEIAANINNALAAMQIGPDGKIYIAKVGADSLDVIDNPNATGAACNYTVNKICLGARVTCEDGLPNMFETSALSAPVTATLTYPPSCSVSGNVSFTDTALGGNITFLWNFGDTIAGAPDTTSVQNPYHTFADSGHFEVTLFMSNACHSDTFKQVVTIAPAAFAINAGADFTLCAGRSSQLNLTGTPGGSTITWSPATGLSCSNCANPLATPDTTTKYVVSVSNNSDCMVTDTLTITVDSCIITGTRINYAYNDINVFPNPSEGNIYLSSNFNETQKFSLEVLNVLGEIIIKQDVFLNSNNIYKVNLLAIPKGFYFIKLSNNDYTTSKKLILK